MKGTIWPISSPTSPTPTTGAPTPSPTIEVTLGCTSIQDIQGDGSTSPKVDEEVSICGVFVTRVVYNGFFVQEVVPNNALVSSGASSGIFVYDPSNGKDVLVEGNRIDITGTVKEYYGMTQISNADFTVLDGAFVFEPIEVMLPLSDLSDLEKYESMLISVKPIVDNTLVVSEYYNFDRYGEVVICSAPKEDGRIFQFTEVRAPDRTLYGEHQDMVERSCVTVDDNNARQNPDPALFGSIYPLDSANFLRGGTEITVLQGPLWYSYSKWRVATLSESDLSYDKTTNPREPVPTISGEVKIANSNLLNYFVTFGERGADNQDEFDRQTNKTINALTEINADIIGVQELENVEGNGAAIYLVSELNIALPNRSYTFASIEASYDEIGTDAIKVDLLFDKNKFNFLGAALLTDDMVDPEIIANSTEGVIFDGKSRVPIAVSLELLDSDEVLTFAVNHFKSKGNRGEAIGLDDDQEDGAGFYNHVRTLSSRALVGWLDSNP